MNRRGPRKLSLVRFDFSYINRRYRGKYPFKEGRSYVFIGEIVNMPRNCVVADHETGKIYSGYHTEHFVELSADEV